MVSFIGTYLTALSECNEIPGNFIFSDAARDMYA